MQDLLVLESEGMVIDISAADDDNKRHHIRAFLSLCIGDTPAMAELALHSGHMSIKGCRICSIEGGKVSNKRGIYFVPNLSMFTPERNYDDYANANDVRTTTLFDYCKEPYSILTKKKKLGYRDHGSYAFHITQKLRQCCFTRIGRNASLGDEYWQAIIEYY